MASEIIHLLVIICLNHKLNPFLAHYGDQSEIEEEESYFPKENLLKVGRDIEVEEIDI